MKHLLTPRKALNKAFLKVKPSREQVNNFKEWLNWLYTHISEEESEEHNKNLLSRFLREAFYSPLYFVNTKGRNDLVIHNGKDSKSSVGVIIEVKRPGNKTEMPTIANINTKALQELVWYFLGERIAGKNDEVRHLIVTNLYEWFIFDAQVFDKVFAQDKSLVKRYEAFRDKQLSSTSTDYFYREIAQPFIAENLDKLIYTYVDLQDYRKALQGPSDEGKLIPLLKILSPEHLLKLPFLNDSNTLDKRFYTELLHIIGLEEVKQGGKKVIERKKDGRRDAGSLLENAINQLDSIDKINRMEDAARFGETYQERLFTVGLELCITWVNRILFLKLLEAQLVRYHKGDLDYSFLKIEKANSFDDLNSLFFGVLARKPKDRGEDAGKGFEKVPYLNSSLFEPSAIEDKAIFISNLRDERSLPIHSQSVLKDRSGKRRTGELNTLEYLFEFLNAYDFSSEGSEDIQEENKTLINASVLGLIFEKINGYKDGSFFTPGFITMYMCRETIRRAVLQKFKEENGWDCKDLDALYDRIEDRAEANRIINSLKICDPAVGSGHFLVSALNEIIAIKSELRILQDREGRRLKEYHFEVVNDELVITDEEGMLFEYRPGSKESQRVQETLFHEKQAIIEGCLFGVDINPNSVKICRLRLWIELLKNAYYKAESGYTELETLPNIDINIKCGNSLVSRFSLDADLSKALRKSKWTIDMYRMAVQTYRNAHNKAEKREMLRLIEDIKSSFRTEISSNDPKVVRLTKLKGELFNLTNQGQLFDRGEKEQAEWNKQLEKLTKEISKLEAEIEEIKNNKIYQNAFEWRFEFPEVLDDEGRFVGFDVVIGNPPYMRVQEIQANQPLQKNFYEKNYRNATSSYDLANIFFELAVNISSVFSFNGFIIPHKYLNSASAAVLREYLATGKHVKEIAHFGANMVFEDANTYTCITLFSKSPSKDFLFQRFPYKSDFKKLLFNKGKRTTITYEMIDNASRLYGSNQWILFDSLQDYMVFKKIYQQPARINTVFERISQGIATGKDELYLFIGQEKEGFVEGRFLSDNTLRRIEKGIMRPFVKGKQIQRYCTPQDNYYILFPYGTSGGGKSTVFNEQSIERNFPNAYLYLKETEAAHRKKDNGSTNDEAWYRYARNQGIDFVEQLKLCSMEICSNYTNVIIDRKGYYHPTTVYGWYLPKSDSNGFEYYLAIANSKLLWWFLKITGDTLQGDARRLKTNYLNPFPIPDNIESFIEKGGIEKVGQVLSIKKGNPAADTIDLENQIDRIVYGLYGLTEEEIQVVENVK